MVLKNSQAAIRTKPALQPALIKLRNALVENGILKVIGSSYIFQQDYQFKSPSQASGVICGSSTNGRKEWKNKDGRTLNDMEN